MENARTRLRMQQDNMEARKVGYHTTHVMRRRGAWFTKAFLIRTPLWLLVFLFFLANSLCVVCFAVLYYAAGDGCYTLSAGFNFAQMLWLSIHVFSTVGFGTDSPGACAWPQVLVFLEHFVALLAVALFAAVIIFNLMQPSPMVRFSEKFLINDESDGKWLTFRMVRESPYQLRDCELFVQCGLVNREGCTISGCSEETLKLECSYKSNLETWFVRHRIDTSSPLHQDRLHDLAYMNVMLKLFDTAFQQEVRLYNNYTPSTDAVHNARFELMKSWHMNEPLQDESDAAGRNEKSRRSLNKKNKFIHHLEHKVDHSQLDSYRLVEV